METILKCSNKIKEITWSSTKAYRKKEPYHYVYTHSIEGIVFYIGKGSHNRAIKVDGRSTYWYKYAFGKKIEVNIVSPLIKEKDALNIENSLILKYKATCINIDFRDSNAVLCFTREGEIIKRYKCIKDTYSDGFTTSFVRKCCIGERGLHKNKIWMFENDYNEKGLFSKIAINHPKIIIQKTKEGKIIRELLTAVAFEKFGFKIKNIQQVCVGKKKSHSGFIFYYK